MKNLSRRQFLSRTTLASAGFALGLKTGYHSRVPLQTDYIIADTAHGKIRGIRERDVNIFKGIPYAGRVSGNRRFLRPAPPEPWTGIRDALQLGPPSIQVPNQTYGINEPEPDEDCLFLNVWTPTNDNRKRPVMFYNHGGGFATGSGGSEAQDGTNLARYFDVVVVETNHRLGLLGYLYLDEVAGEEYKGSGNNGLLDIIDGLKWVRENISMFGGDPENVMIFGESGGGAKTSCLHAMPGAVPYFNKVSIESGPGIRMIPKEIAAETTALLFKLLNISSSDWRRLLELPVTKLLELQISLPKAAGPLPNQPRAKGIVAPRPGNFAPVVDGEVLPSHPFDPSAPEISRNKPLIIGWNEDEYTFFAAAWSDVSGLSLDFDGLRRKLELQFGKDAETIISTYRGTRPKASASNIFVEIMSETLIGLGSVEIAEKKAEQKGAPVFLYNFGFKSHNKVPNSNYELGTPHALDITFKFNNVVPGGLPESVTAQGDWPARIKASRNFAEFWTTFAKTGVPSATGQPYWASYSLKRRPTMRIDTECEIIYNRYRVEREMWRSLGYLS